jgi:hypothetical protein
MTPHDLSHQAATTVTHDMTTERWPHTRDFLTGLLADTPDSTTALARIDLAHDQLTEAETPEETDLYRKATIRHLTQRLHQVLTRHPTATTTLQAFLTTRETPPPTNITQTATATHNSHIFQSGGNQNITYGNNPR